MPTCRVRCAARRESRNRLECVNTPKKPNRPQSDDELFDPRAFDDEAADIDVPVYRREASEGTAPAGKKSAQKKSDAKQPVDKKPATAKPAAEKSASLGKTDKAAKPASFSAAQKSAESDKAEKAGKAGKAERVRQAQQAQKVESPAEATKVHKAVGEPKVGKLVEKATVGKPAGESKTSGGSEGDKPKRRDIYEVLGRARPQRIQTRPQPKEPLPQESQDERGARDAAAGAAGSAGAAGVAAAGGAGARAGKDAGPADRTVKPIPAAQPGSASGNPAGAKSGADNGREDLSFLKRNETKPVPVAGAAGAAGVAGAATADRADAAQVAGKAGNDAHAVKADNRATPENVETVKTDGAGTVGTVETVGTVGAAETAETPETTTKEAQPKRGTLSFGLLLLRLVIGGLLLVRGLQTLFAFGGDPGLDVLQQQWSDYNGAQILAVVVPAAEVIAGGLLILGLLTPFAAALAAVVAGFMTLNEFNNYQGTLWPYGLSPYIHMWVLIGTGTMATIFAGPGSISLDRNRAWNTRPLVSAWIFTIVAVAATVVLWLAIGGGNPFN